MISRESAVAAALAVIDERGLAGFGLGAVAERLGVRAPSLYHHFASKEALLYEVAMSLLIEGQLPPIAPDPQWVEQIVRISLTSWRSVLRHPKAALLMLQFVPVSLVMGAYEHWVHYLAVNDVPLHLHLVIIDGTDKLTFGSILFASQNLIDGKSRFDHADPERHPYMTRANAALTLSEEASFANSIRNFVLGVLTDDRLRSEGERVAEMPSAGNV
jgi:AcrR family transcriptional regulator